MSLLLDILNDPDAAPDVKEKALAKVWTTASPGDKREYYYERYLRNPGRAAVGHALDTPAAAYRAGVSGTAAAPNIAGRAASNLLVPEDLQGALQTAALGAATGGLGTAGLLAKAGIVGAGEIGGIAGGKVQGKTTEDAAMSSAPGALVGGVLPAISERTAAFERGASNKATSKIGQATIKLFRRLFADNPALQPPTDPHALHMMFGTGDASPAVVAAGKGLEKNRSVIRNLQKQPAFANMPPVTVPYKTTSFIPGAMPTVQRGQAQVSLSDALDYLQGMYGKGYALTGTPRGSIQAEPDRDIAALVRKQIVAHLKNIPKFGPRLAQDFQDYSHDYGVAKTLPQVFRPDIVTEKGLLEHNQVYKHLADPKVLNHLKNLDVNTQDYLEQVVPGGQRIMDQSPSSIRAHGGAVGFHLPIPRPPLVPPEFVPNAQKIVGPLGAQATTNYIEGQE